MTLPGVESPPNADGREVVLRFRPQEDGRMRSTWAGRAVIAGREYEKSAHIKPGERWRVLLHDKIVVLIAEPLVLESPPTPPPSHPHASLAQTPPPSNGVRSSAQAEVEPAPANHRRLPRAPTNAPPASVSLEQDSLLPPSAMRVHDAELRPDDVIRPDERVAFFIDAPNLYFAARDLGLDIDWHKLIRVLLGNARFADAYFYAPGNLDAGFLDNLARSGYTIRRKPIKIIHDHATGERLTKANLDTDIILDMITTAPTFDVAYLASGDSDFARVIEYLRQHGRRVYVLSSRGTLSRELTRCANKPIYHLEDLRNHLVHDPTMQHQEQQAEKAQSTSREE